MSARSRRVLVVAHCILNANARYAGGAHRPGADLRTLEPYLHAGVGIVQLPCPESGFAGMSRPQMTRDQYDTAVYRRHCRDILLPTVDTLEEFSRAGYAIEGVIGVKGSPSCGVSETSESRPGTGDALLSARVPGYGVMMSVLAEMLAERELPIVMSDVSSSD